MGHEARGVRPRKEKHVHMNNRRTLGLRSGGRGLGTLPLRWAAWAALAPALMLCSRAGGQDSTGSSTVSPSPVGPTTQPMAESARGSSATAQDGAVFPIDQFEMTYV